ncbi:6969_t:CDS:2 [Funneliformis geosporum]|uniref:6969_t:CDS:1 n=1 Tax=Funneliformis geosporum TaxID=1117311 RepID=A0A9W4SCV5_9GLOM|nr:6969_t:CDS:2 [Funneliformis geosporum]
MHTLIHSQGGFFSSRIKQYIFTIYFNHRFAILDAESIILWSQRLHWHLAYKIVQFDMNVGEFYKTLSIDYNKLLTTCEDYNVIIGVGNDSNYMKFHAHSCILRARSPYFYSALSKEWVKRNEEGFILFEKPNIDPKIFQCILEYIYGGMIDLNDYEPTFILDLITASDELILTELCKFSQDFLIKVQDKWIRENPVEILTHSTAFHLESCKELIDYCLEIICDNPSLIFEIQNYDDSKWVEEDLFELEIILKNCVPLIRIDLISCKELPIELKPFQRMLTKNNSFIDDNSNSTIIKWRHAAILSKWIDRQETLYRKSSHTFPVLSRIRKDHHGMALFCADVRGPSFGCHDLWMPNFNNLSLRCASKRSYYEKTIIDTRKFDVEEYEVFQVIDNKVN